MNKLYALVAFISFLVAGNCINVHAQTIVYTNDFTGAGTVIPGGTPALTFTNVLGNATRSGVQVGGTDPVPTTFTNNQLVEWVSGGPYVIVGTSTTNSYSQTTAPLSGYSAPFNATLSANTSIVTWTFNMSTTIAASGFANTQDNAVVVLAGTSATLGTAGNGYAVAFNPATPRAIELIRYTGGLQGTVTTIISSSVLLANATDYASVRVTYDPTTNTWTLYVRDDGTAAFANPAVGVTTSGGSAVDATYTGTAMSSFGFFSNHEATSISLLVYLDADNYSYFDNYTVSVNCTLPAITGITTVCQGSTTTLSDPTSGGTWISGNTVVATIGSSSGVVTGNTTGTSAITYTSGGCTATTVVTVIATPSAISGTTVVCQGANTNLTDATGAGTWSSSNTAVGTVGLSTGVVSGISGGTTTITFTLTATGCTAATVVTVNPLPTVILGTPVVCAGLSTTLSDLTLSGTWGISNANGNIGSGTGMLTGVTAGTATVSYTLGTGCYVTTIATINPTPTAINGVTNICQGLGSSLTDALGGGTWMSDNTGVATIGSSSGALSGVGSGTANITYTMPTGCLIATTVTVNPAPTAIAGTLTVCEGLNTPLSDGVTGGIWTSSNANATVGSLTGIVTGVTAGTATISYTTATCNPVLAVVTINPSPALISGVLSVCNGLTTTLSDAVTGGTWVSSNTGIATIGSSLGNVSAFSVGTINITYTLPAGCNTISVFTVNPSPVAISGAPVVCQGLSTTLSDLTGGGTWSTSNANTNVGSASGVVTGVNAGTSTVSFTLPAGCYSTTTFTVNPLPAAITGLASGCAGLVINLSDVTAGGTWSSSSSAIAPVGSSSGVVTGFSVGTATITYMLPTGCISILVVTVNASPLAIVGPDNVCVGSSVLLNDPAIGGTWASSNTVAGTIGSTSGVLSGLSPGTTTITYTLPIGGCTATNTITVNPLPAAISGQDSLCAGGYSVTLSDVTSGGSWASSNTSVATVGSVTGTVFSVAAGTTTITYALGTGCNSTVTFTVNPLPSGISGANIVCIGLTTNLSDLSAGGTWSSSNADVSVGSASGAVTGASAGSSIIIYTLLTGCITTFPITVNTPPTAIGGPTAVCIGNAITLTDGISTGTWSVTNASGTANITSGGIVTGLTTGTVLVSYSTLACNPATYPVTINPLPAAITGIGTVCFGSTISLSDVSPGGSWSSSNASVGVSSTGAVSGLTAGSGSTITYMLPTGCYVTAPVNVDAIPSPILGTDTVCLGSSVVLSDTTAGGVWSSSDGTIATSIAFTGEVIGATAGTVNISYTLVSGCYVIMPFRVKVPLPALLSISQFPDSLLCDRQPVTLVANVTNGGAPTFVWEIFGSYLATGDTLRYDPTHGDYVTCTMTTHSVCASPAVVHANITMNVFPLVAPVVAISTLGPDTSSYLGQVYTFYTDVTFGGSAPTYQWYVDRDSIPGATNATFTTRLYNENDTVYCVVRGNSPCDTTTYVGTSNSIIIEGKGYLSAGNLSGIKDLSLFPNPNTGNFILSGTVDAALDKEAVIEISDMLGRIVYTGTVAPQNGAIRKVIALDNDIASGPYLLHVHTDTGNTTFHFVISK